MEAVSVPKSADKQAGIRQAPADEQLAPNAQTEQGARAGLPVFLQPKLLAMSAPDDPYEREADEAGARLAAKDGNQAPDPPRVSKVTPHAPASGLSAPASMIPDGGRPLPHMLQAQFERSFGEEFAAILPAVRIHVDSRAAANAQAIQARAFTAGSHIVFGSGEFDPASVRGRSLLAHELTHVVQQGKGEATPLVQRAPDPTQQTLTPAEIQLLSLADLRESLGMAQAGLAKAGLEAATSSTVWNNLKLLLDDLRRRGEKLAGLAAPRTAANPGELATAGQIAALDKHYELVDLLVERQLKQEAPDLHQRITERRTLIQGIHQAAVLEEGERVENLRIAIESLVQSKQLAPTAPINDVDLAGPALNFQRAVSFAGLALLTTAQTDAMAAMEVARSDFLSGFARSLLRAAKGLQTELPKIANIPLLSNYEEGLFTRTPGGPWPGRDDVKFFREMLNLLTKELAGYGDLQAQINAPPEQRLKLLFESGDKLMLQLRQIQALMVAGYGIALIAYFQEQISSRESFGDATMINAMRANFVASMLEPLHPTGAPSAGAIERAQFALERDAPEPTDDAARKSQRERHLAYRKQMGQEGEEPETDIRRRFRTMAEFDRDFGYFAGFAASIFGMLAGAAAAGAVLEANIFKAGLLAGRTFGAGAIRFAVQSLTFTTVSQALTRFMMAQGLPTAKEFLKTAGMDALTMGFLHVIGLPFSRVGVQVPTGVQFAALWAWSAGWQIIPELITNPDKVTLGGVATTIVRSGAETAVMLAAMHFATRVGILPMPDLTGQKFRTITPDQRVALDAYIAAQKNGQGIARDAVAWQQGERRPEVIADLMRRSQGFLGEYRTALEKMRDSGLMPATEATGLLKQSVEHMDQIRNVHQSLQLGLEVAGQQTIRYNGDTRNLDFYLRRLQRQGVVAEITPLGNGGIYEVRYKDGGTRYFYPEGSQGGPRPDFLADALTRILPNQPALVTQVLHSLERMPGEGASRVIAAAEQANNPASVLSLMVQPEIMLEMARPNTLYTPELIEQALRGDASALQVLQHAEKPITLQRWHQTEFEKVAGGRSVSNFLSFLEQAKLYHGTLAVSSVGEARHIATQLAGAQPTMRVFFGPIVDAPSISDPSRPSRPRAAPSARPEDFFQRQGYTDGLRTVRINKLDLYYATDAAGRPTRAWVFQANSAHPALEIDVRTHLQALEQGLAAADRATSAAEARTVLEGLRPHYEALQFLRRLRDAGLSKELALLDKAEFDPRGPNARPPEFMADLPGPTAAASRQPLILDPVTPSEILSNRQQLLLDRAARMGVLSDPAILEAASLRPRLQTSREGFTAVRRSLDAAEQHLNRLGKDAAEFVKQQLGEQRFQRLSTRLFAGRAESEVGEILHGMRQRTGFSAATLDALLRLPDSALPTLQALQPAVLVALGEVAASRPQVAAELLAKKELLLDLQSRPDVAARFIALADLLVATNAPFTDLHRHLPGAIFHPEGFIDAMARATLLDVPKADPAKLTNARLQALNVAYNRLQTSVEKLKGTLPADSPMAKQMADRWTNVKAMVEQFRDVLADSIRNQQSSNVDDLRDTLVGQVRGLFTLPMETAALGAQVDVFFPLYTELAAQSKGTEGRTPPLQAGVTAAQVQRVAYVEFRTGLSKELRRELAKQKMVGPDGQPLPDVRIVITVPRHLVNAKQIAEQIRELGPLAERVVGFDLSGRESAPLEPAKAQILGETVARYNFGELSTMLAAHPTLAAEVQTRLGYDPVEAGKVLLAQLDTGPALAGTTVVAHPAADLAQLNRRVREIVTELDARDGDVRLPKTLLGTTVHAGEQLRGDLALNGLLNDIEVSLNAGVDRIGHGAVLGIRLPSDLAALGFTMEAGGAWSRASKTGGQPERYTPSHLAAMEAQRVRLIRQIGDLGVTIEINPTSNIVLSGLRPLDHPIGEIMAVRPNIRLAVSTDNPAIHLTDPARELALATAVAGADTPQMIRFYLEGYSARMGGRPLGNAATVRQQVREAILALTPASERGSVINELNERYQVGRPMSYAPTMDAATFNNLLTPYLNLVIR
jgi:hypothetical protein